MTREGRQIQTTPKRCRFVALLFAIAATCELAAHAPAPVRRAMLYFLLRAEVVAHSIVYWSLRDCGATFSWALPEAVRHETCPEAALALAEWFRVLAVALRDLPRRMLIEGHRSQSSAAASLRAGVAREGHALSCCGRRLSWHAPIPDT